LCSKNKTEEFNLQVKNYNIKGVNLQLITSSYFDRGLILKRQKNFKEAIAAMEKAATSDPYVRLKALTEKGLILMEMGCYIDALDLFFLFDKQGYHMPEDVIEKLQCEKGIMEGLQGRVCLQNNDIQKAITFFQSSIKSNPRDKAVWRMFGEASEKSKDYSEAILCYRRSVDSGEEKSVVMYNQAVCYYNIREYFKAISLFEEFLDINPDHISAKEYKDQCEAILDLI
jgi:tetratricopeptide (TPR) repeat protein